MTKPIFRWAGGKRWLAPTLAPTINKYLDMTGGTYYEPFLGGAAVTLEIGPRKAVLGDSCEPLIRAYQAIQNHPKRLQEEIDR